jgi:hypothetical protein
VDVGTTSIKFKHSILQGLPHQQRHGQLWASMKIGDIPHTGMRNSAEEVEFVDHCRVLAFILVEYHSLTHEMASVSQLQVPREPFLLDLFWHWQQSPEAIVLRDHSAKKREFSVAEFLHDVLTLRQKIFDSLDEDAKVQLTSHDMDVFVAILAAPGYGFAALFFAIYSLGAVAVPLCL